MKREDLKNFFKDWYNGEFISENSESILLTEQEDLFGDAEEEPAEDDAGGEAEEEPAEGEEGEAEEGEGEGEAEEVEEEEVVAIEPGDEVRLGKQFDIAIDGILQDYEMNALKSAQIHTAAKEEMVQDAVDDTTNEWWSRDLSSLLFEQEEEVQEEEVISETQLDIDLFSNDVARLINNYDSLMDMESIIFNKAKEFLIIKYGEEVAEAFSEILKLKHGLDFDSEIQALEDIEVAAPIAVGATGGGGGGAV